MSQAIQQPLKDIPESVAEQLRLLRQRIALWLLVDGLSHVLPLVLLVAAVDFVIDFGLHAWTGYQLDFSQRAILLVLGLAALAAAVVWRLVLPLLRPLGDDALVLEVERRHRQLAQSLISAVQFARMAGVFSPGVSRSMIDATIELGIRNAAEVRFGEVLNRKRFQMNLAVLAASAALLALGAFGVSASPTLSTWFNRNVLLAEESWPQDVYFDIAGAEHGIVTIVRGDDHRQLVTISEESRRVPDEVWMEFRPANLRPAEQMKREKDPREFSLEFKNVLEEFDFRVYAGTAVSPWTHVKLLPPPQVEELAIEVTPPAYTRGPTGRLPTGKGPYAVLRGSSLRLAGWTNKPLDGEKSALLIEGATLPMQLSAGNRFLVEIPAEQVVPGKYVLALVDTEGLENRRPPSFGLRIRADDPPRVRAKLLGISGMVVPGALIPIDCRVTDDYVITDVRIEYRWQGDTASKADHVPLASQADNLATRPRGLDFQDVFDLEPLAIPTGATLTFQVAADDNDDVSGPNTGRSTEFLVRVVTEEQLRTDLLRREKEQRQEFEQLLKSQEDLVTDTRALQAALAGQEKMENDQRQTLMQLQRNQKRIAINVENIAKRLAEVTVEVQNNRLEEEDGPLQKRLIEQIIQPMANISEQAVPEAVRRLDRARRLEDKQDERDPALSDAVAQQQAVAAAMREILLHMVKTEGYQEAVNLLYEIEKSQKGVFDLTAREMQERIQRILNEGGNLPDEPKKP